MATYTTKQQKAVLDCLSERADSPGSAAAIVDALREIEYEDIPRAGRLLYATAALSLVLFGAVRFLLVM